jgi:DNA-binding GntR family transcriptional regulator
MSRPLRNDEPLHPPTLVDFAVSKLRDEIISGELQPGTALPFRDHAARLGISPIPMREALQRLEQAGLVIWRPHRGARVAEASIQDMEDTYRVRLALEVMAIKEAAKHFGADDEAVARQAFREYADAARAGDTGASRAAHAAFHLALYRPANSGWIDRMVPQLWDNAERYRRMALQGLGIDQRISEHRRLLDVCRSNDSDAAGKALQEHFEHTQQVLRDRLGNAGADGQIVRELKPVSSRRGSAGAVAIGSRQARPRADAAR